MDREIARILDELEREHGGSPWHGTSLRAILAGVDHHQAGARPLDGAHTIWEIVLHMTAWKNEVRRRIGGAPAGDPPEGDWPVPPPPAAQAWCEALDALEDAHRALVAAIARLPDAVLPDPINDPRHADDEGPVSHYVLLHGIVQHDAYHAGQVALLTKALAGTGA